MNHKVEQLIKDVKKSVSTMKIASKAKKTHRKSNKFATTANSKTRCADDLALKHWKTSVGIYDPQFSKRLSAGIYDSQKLSDNDSPVRNSKGWKLKKHKVYHIGKRPPKSNLKNKLGFENSPNTKTMTKQQFKLYKLCTDKFAKSEKIVCRQWNDKFKASKFENHSCLKLFNDGKFLTLLIFPSLYSSILIIL